MTANDTGSEHLALIIGSLVVPTLFVVFGPMTLLGRIVIAALSAVITYAALLPWLAVVRQEKELEEYNAAR